MKRGFEYPREACSGRGEIIAENWYIRHVKTCKEKHVKDFWTYIYESAHANIRMGIYPNIQEVFESACHVYFEWERPSDDGPMEASAIRDKLIDAIAIMDEKGRPNEEDNSYMLWKKDWYHLRYLLLDALHEAA